MQTNDHILKAILEQNQLLIAEVRGLRSEVKNLKSELDTTIRFFNKKIEEPKPPQKRLSKRELRIQEEKNLDDELARIAKSIIVSQQKSLA